MTHERLYHDWLASGLSPKQYWRQHCYGMTFGQFMGRKWRTEQKLYQNSHYFTHDFGKPWALDAGHYIVIGDVHVPTTDYDFAALPMAVADTHLPAKKRNLIIAGDFINADAFSSHPSDVSLPSFMREIEAARAFLAEYRRVFDRVYWIMGNHERRIGKMTRAALSPDNLRAMITDDRNVFVSSWGWLTVSNPGGADWRITHGRAYGVNQLTVSDMLALKFQQNIISHHEHHLGKGWDRYKRYVVVNNGGLFDQRKLAYVQMDDSKMPNMTPGFSWLKPNGTVDVFGEHPFTDWEAWLPRTKKGKIVPFKQVA